LVQPDCQSSLPAFHVSFRHGDFFLKTTDVGWNLIVIVDPENDTSEAIGTAASATAFGAVRLATVFTVVAALVAGRSELLMCADRLVTAAFATGADTLTEGFPMLTEGFATPAVTPATGPTA
jgi:hypothetical protein